MANCFNMDVDEDEIDELLEMVPEELTSEEELEQECIAKEARKRKLQEKKIKEPPIKFSERFSRSFYR